MEILKKKFYNLNAPEIRIGSCHGQEYAALACEGYLERELRLDTICPYNGWI